MTGGDVNPSFTGSCPTGAIPLGANLTVNGTPVAVSITSVTGNTATITVNGTVPGTGALVGTLTLVCAATT
ncbi:hypothetical protein GCM10010448_34550 [Streptomyces glomeratus]|uniref:Uncharacterized protein n=1 Tax=Streptomyces glomeratus TaxID=284452 RepID=A0ABP6LNW4_9ACTN